MNMNPAPPKPPSKTADRKALAAYYSELRRWAQALERWEADLDERESTLDEQQGIFEAALENADDPTVQRYADRSGYTVVDESDDEEDCGCNDEAAAAGCDCPTCEDTRQEWLRISREHKGTPKTSDEVNQLEALWKLEDKRT